MIHPTDMRARLQGGEVMIGIGLGTPAPAIIEAVCPGWDFIWIDGQHGQHDDASLLHCVRTASMMEAATILRPAGHETSVLGRCADMAPTSVMVPMVDDAERAEAIVRDVRYPPRGDRSFGGKRVLELYGFAGALEQQPVLLLQIETPTGIDNAAEIVNVDGVDGLFFGAEDVKLRMGLPPEASVANNDKLRDALHRVAKAATDAGKWAGLVAVTPEMCDLAIDCGCRIIAVATDSRLLRGANAEAQQTFGRYRGKRD